MAISNGIDSSSHSGSTKGTFTVKANTGETVVVNNVTTEGKPFRIAASTRARLDKAGIDYSKGYPEVPPKPKSSKLARRAEIWEHDDPAKRADPEKKALFSAAKEVITLTPNIGTEIVGLQLSQLTNQQKDELALLIAERVVVFFRDQDISPQDQVALGEYFGKLEVHPAAARVTGLPGCTVVSDEFANYSSHKTDFRNPFGTQNWHTDLTHERQPPGITHLHIDACPSYGGDTYWASGYLAYDKLSPEMQRIIETLQGIYRSDDSYEDVETGDIVPITDYHPLVRTHPVTGWRSLFVNRRYTIGIRGMTQADSAPLLNRLFDVYDGPYSLEGQVRFKWTPRTSALWDNRVSIHAAVYDYQDSASEPRHGTRVSSLAEKPYLDPKSTGQREARGLDLGYVNELGGTNPFRGSR